MNHLIGRKKILLILCSLLGSYITFPVFFERILFSLNDHSQNWLSLDPSWIVALTKSFSNKLKFGTEFALTYGPLSFLSTRLLLGINKYYLLFFDVFVSINVFFVFYCSLKRSTAKITVAILIVLCLISLPVYFGAGTSILLLTLELFWLIEFVNHQKIISLCAAAFISTLLLLIKFNTGFISFFLLLIVVSHGFMTQAHLRTKLLILIISFVCLFIGFAQVLNIQVWAYFKTGFMMVEGYSDLMVLDQHLYLELFFALFCMLSCFIILVSCLKQLKVKTDVGIMHVILFCIPSYVLYKQGFTRADPQHIREFYAYFPLLILAFPQFINTPLSPIFNKVILLPTFISCCFAFNSDNSILETLLQRLIKTNYIKSFQLYTEKSGNRIDSTQNQLPIRIKNKIGQSKIDAYPWNLIELYENNLNVATRPIIQSYTAYTKELEQMNAAHYESGRSPEFVLYDFASIDNRYPLCDEPLLNLKLVKSYSVYDTLHSYNRFKLLLKKTNDQKISLIPLKTYTMSCAEKIIPKENTYYQIELKKSLQGKLQSLLWHSPQLVFQIMDGNKNLHEFHTSINLLETGFFSNVYFDNTNDVLNMFLKKPSEKQNKIIFYGLRLLDRNGFASKITVKEYKIIN